MPGVSAIAIRFAVSCLAWGCRRRKLCLDDILRVFRGIYGAGHYRTKEDPVDAVAELVFAQPVSMKAVWLIVRTSQAALFRHKNQISVTRKTI
jgi:hypothetical protein